jgi:hypothetical protein
VNSTARAAKGALAGAIAKGTIDANRNAAGTQNTVRVIGTGRKNLAMMAARILNIHGDDAREAHCGSNAPNIRNNMKRIKSGKTIRSATVLALNILFLSGQAFGVKDILPAV